MTAKTVILNGAKEARAEWLAIRSLVDPALTHNADTEWLFILTLPNSGSTALARLLLTAPGTCALNENGEGQWLIPSLSASGHRWDAEFVPSMRKVRATWLQRAARNAGGNRCLVIEKSPPNLCRIDAFLEAFKTMNARALVLLRNPYATCASWFARYRPADLAEQTGDRSLAVMDDDSAYIDVIARVWIKRAEQLLRARAHAVLTLRYEDLTAHPDAAIEQLAALWPQLGGVDLKAPLDVKDHTPRVLRNMNDAQIAELTTAQLAQLTAIFSQHREILGEMGYDLL